MVAPPDFNKERLAPMTQAQVSNRLSLTLERQPGKAPGTVIFHFSGPFTARSAFASQSPDAVSNLLDLQSMLPSGQLPVLNIFNLAAVPYMDSAGLGMVVKHYTRCQDKGVRFIVAGATPRVLELFKLTKVDTIIPMIPTLEEADTLS
jgi:anti-anti-sigma factor